MHIILAFINHHPIATCFIAFVGPIFAWEVYQHRFRPLLIPKAQINRMIDDLIEKYGPSAEH